jgi:hypothetical protein
MRAYVLISGAKVESVAVRSHRTVHIAIRNFGRTPASNVKFWAVAGVLPFPLDISLLLAPEGLQMASSVLPPAGMPSIMEVPISPTPDDHERRLNLVSAAIYAWGQVTYVDAFGEDRTTDFRFMCFGDGLREGKMAPCETGNNYS